MIGGQRGTILGIGTFALYQDGLVWIPGTTYSSLSIIRSDRHRAWNKAWTDTAVWKEEEGSEEKVKEEEEMVKEIEKEKEE